MSYCKLCRRWKPDERFWQRNDRPALYSWCISCCKAQGRSTDYPARNERGGGVLVVNLKSLKPGYNELEEVWR